MDEIKRTGIILYVRNYDECIDFYSRKMELEILFRNDSLVCFDLFGTYLMVEKEDRDTYCDLKSDHLKVFSCIRMNVDNIKAFSEKLEGKNIVVDYQEHDWGIVAKFYDPDGNLLAFKDEDGFIKQLENR